MKEKKINLELDGTEAGIVYHRFQGSDLNTLILSFGEKRKVLSTFDGYRAVSFVGNNYTPLELSERTMRNYQKFARELPLSLGICPRDIALLSTGVSMDNLNVCEKSYEEFKVCCLATAGAKGNALRAGVDKAHWIERNGKFVEAIGTINLIILTNSALSSGAMAHAIINATEAKTAALQDLDVKSTYSQNQATGTGTDNVIVVSGKDGKRLTSTSGHTKMGELIGYSTKNAVTEALKKQDGCT